MEFSPGKKTQSFKHYNTKKTLCVNVCTHADFTNFISTFRMFGMVLERLYLQDMQKISGEVEQKICAVGVTNILTEAPAMIQNYEAFWWVYSPITENMSIFLYSSHIQFFFISTTDIPLYDLLVFFFFQGVSYSRR